MAVEVASRSASRSSNRTTHARLGGTSRRNVRMFSFICPQQFSAYFHGEGCHAGHDDP
jgi:hypothetical protein